MDATTRWETEAIRAGGGKRKGPPRPTSKRADGPREWVTLKEAETATGIPSNTLRKWVRKSGLPSYLESDGDFILRMVDLGAVRERASELGRALNPEPSEQEGTPEPPTPTPPPPPPAAEAKQGDKAKNESEEPEPEPAQQAPETQAPPGTMIVPIDAWNKMLGQLGNLHEAGQQLAEARERAAKAETEAEFLRRRLAELREERVAPPPAATDPSSTEAPEEPAQHGRTTRPSPPDTTTYWRYVTSGWRNRRRRSSGS